MDQKALIIGHGPSGYETGLGEFIDHYDGAVVRLVFSNWQPREHYGWRTDYSCTTWAKRRKMYKDERRPSKETWIYMSSMVGTFLKYSVVKKLSDRRRKFIIDEFAGKGFEDVVVCHEELTHWAKRYVEVQNDSDYFYRYFTNGVASIMIAPQRIAGLEKIELLGFDNLLAGDKDNYYRCMYPSLKANAHNLKVEKILVEEVSKYHGIEIGPCEL
jgi:hypothetical protein